jgi:hypothetical protein
MIAVLDFALVTGKGWSKVFSGTNKAVYRAPQGNRFYLRVDDTGATGATARVRGHVTMSDVDTGTEQWPSVEAFWPRSDTADASARQWFVIADEKLAYVYVNRSTNLITPLGDLYMFGDTPSLIPGDAYCTHTVGPISAAGNVMSAILSTVSASSGHWSARHASQAAGASGWGKIANYGRTGGVMGSGNFTYPYPGLPGSALLMERMLMVNATPNVIRSVVPGLWAAAHSRPLAHGDTFSGAAGTYLAGRSFISLWAQSSGAFIVETSDTWYT